DWIARNSRHPVAGRRHVHRARPLSHITAQSGESGQRTSPARARHVRRPGHSALRGIAMAQGPGLKARGVERATMTTKSRVGRFAAIGILLTSVACGGGNSASAPPAPTNAPPKIAFEKYTLPNGLEVILSEDKRLPMVSVDLWY